MRTSICHQPSAAVLNNTDGGGGGGGDVDGGGIDDEVDHDDKVTLVSNFNSLLENTLKRDSFITLRRNRVNH